MNANRDVVLGALRQEFADMLRRDVRRLLSRAHRAPAAEAVAAILWPQMVPDTIVRLDQLDPVLLRPQVSYNASEIINQAKIRLAERVEARFNATAPLNRHASGGKLRKEVQNFFGYRPNQAELERACSMYLDSTGGACEADVRNVKTDVLRLLHERLYQELEALGTSSNEDEPKRRLKILTALATVTGSGSRRHALIREITSGRTAALPFTLKYHRLGSPPEGVANLREASTITFAGFSRPMLDCIKGAEGVRRCLVNYTKRQGLLSLFLDRDAPVTEENRANFERLATAPRQMREGGIFAPMSEQLSANRPEAYRMLDGVVCCVGIAITLESVLKQIASAFGKRVGDYDRGSTLMPRIRQHVSFSQSTESALNSIFNDDGGHMALRDGLAHGAFVANDPGQLDANLGILTAALQSVVQDLANEGRTMAIFGSEPWSAANKFPAALEVTFEQQWWLNNLIRDGATEPRRAHAFQVFSILIPDKSRLAKSALLFWADLEGGTWARLGLDEGAQVAAILAAALALEELFRAVSEVHGQRVLKVTSDGNEPVLRTELLILDVRDGQLLEEDRLNHIFTDLMHQEEFRDCMTAVRVLRDQVIHGGWAMLEEPRVRYLHLMIKVILELCDTVQIDPSGTPTPAVTPVFQPRVQRTSTMRRIEKYLLALLAKMRIQARRYQLQWDRLRGAIG